VKLKAGDIITVDGATGEVMLGAVPMIKPELTGDFAALMEWADAARRMKVRTNAETPPTCRPRGVRRRRHRAVPHRAHVL
jgi:pyruvate,orthophosphate dikinase